MQLLNKTTCLYHAYTFG